MPVLDGVAVCLIFFSLTVGVRQGGVLSPLLFNIYVDSFIQRLQSSGVGCRIGYVILVVSCMQMILLCLHLVFVNYSA